MSGSGTNLSDGRCGQVSNHRPTYINLANDRQMDRYTDRQTD